MSSFGSSDSDNASGFWDPPIKHIKEEYKREPDQEHNYYSDSLQDSLSEGEDVSEKEFEYTKEIESKHCNNNKYGRNRTGKSEEERKPFYVPRKPHFFEHDIRILDDEEEEEVKEKKKWNGKKAQDINCWHHDLFSEEEQKPKSRRELIDSYGYDIRSDSPTSIGENSCKDWRPKRHQDYNSTNNRNYEGIRKELPEQRLRNKSAQSQYKDGNRFKERNFFKEESTKKTPSSDGINDIEVLKIEKLSIHPSETYSKASVSNLQDRMVAATPGSSSGNSAREDSPLKISGCRENINSNVNSPVNSRVVKNINLPNSSQKRLIYPSHLSNIKSANSSNEIKIKIVEKNCDNCSHCYKTNGNCDDNISVHGPLNVSDRKLLELERKSEIVDNNNSLNSMPSTYNYFREMYNVDYQENFEFPDPPDLSANHLMPCIPQQQYYVHPYYQQGLGSLMKWEFYGQPYYQSTSVGGVAFVKQYVSPWASPHQSNMMPSPPQIDSSPYYALQDDGIRNMLQNSLAPNCLQATCFLN